MIQSHFEGRDGLLEWVLLQCTWLLMNECWICMDEDKWCHIALEGQERRERWMEVKNKAEGKREGECRECGEGSWEEDSVSYELQSERPLSSEAWAAVETIPRKYGNHLLTIALRLQIINLEFRVIVTKIQNLAVSHSFLSARLCFIWNISFREHLLFFWKDCSRLFAWEKQPTSACILCWSPHTTPASHSTHRGYSECTADCAHVAAVWKITNLKGSNWPIEQLSIITTTSACVCLYITVWYSSRLSTISVSLYDWRCWCEAVCAHALGKPTEYFIMHERVCVWLSVCISPDWDWFDWLGGNRCQHVSTASKTEQSQSHRLPVQEH